MVKTMLCDTLCRRTLSWEPWRWERTCVSPQRCGSPAPFLRPRRRPEWTTSLQSWVWPRWPTLRCIYTHALAIFLQLHLQKWAFCGWRVPEWNQGSLSGCFASGGHSGDSRDLWRREEEDQHWHGADYWPLGALSGRTNLGAGRQHRQLCPVIAEKVQKE